MKETAIVFRSGNRRFFTKNAALRHSAKMIYRERFEDIECGCENGDEFNSAWICKHHNWDLYGRRFVEKVLFKIRKRMGLKP